MMMSLLKVLDCGKKLRIKMYLKKDNKGGLSNVGFYKD